MLQNVIHFLPVCHILLGYVVVFYEIGVLELAFYYFIRRPIIIIIIES